MKISLKQLRAIIQEEVNRQAGTRLNEATDIDKLADMVTANTNAIGEIQRRLTAVEDKAENIEFPGLKLRKRGRVTLESD